MNKVYKIVWSKVKHCYVVASEFAKTNGKSPSKALVGAVLLSLLSMPAFASGVDNGIVTSQDGYAGGTVPIVTGNGSIAIGTHAVASGNNMTWEQLKAMMDEYNIKKDNHDDLSSTVAQDTIDKANAQGAYDQASTAAAAVQAARDAQAGYQSDLDNHNTQKPAIDDAYNTAKNEYETLYNDFQNRLNQIKYIDFTVYADGSAAGYDYNQMASDLKTNTESGTTFDMPVSFYYDYIQNYIKANGDLRLAQTAALANNYKINYSANSWYAFNEYVVGNTKYSTGVAAQNFYDLLKIYYPDMETLCGARYFIRDTNGNIVKEFGSSSSSSDLVVWSMLGTASNGSSVPASLVNGIINAGYFTETERDNGYNTINSTIASNLNQMINICDKLVELNIYSQADRDAFISIYSNYLNADGDILKSAIDVGYYQKLYEDTGDIAYIGNKELALRNIDNILKSGVASLYDINGLNSSNNINYGSGTTLKYGMMEFCKRNLADESSPLTPSQALSKYFKENITDIQDATVVALQAVSDGLEGQLAEKRQAYEQAAIAKQNLDNQIANLQTQIANLEPTPEQVALANELDQKAQDLQNAKDKFNADEQALQQAYQDMLDAQVGEIGEGAIAIGYNTITTGKNAIGMGTDAVVTAEEAIALGKGTVVSGQNSIGIGSDNSISQPNAIAIGTNNGITGANSIAIGNNNIISGANSIAIGNGLNISEDNVVALGGKKVSGVTNGTVATDAATVGQTYELVAGDGMSIVEDGINAIGQKKFKLNSTATGGTTYTSGSNIVIEDDVISAEGLLRYDGEDKKTASLEGTGGTKLTNLKQASLTRTSTDAVIGAQLWQTNSNVAGMQSDITTNANNISALTSGLTSANNAISAISTTIDTVMDEAASKSLNNLSDVGRQVIANAATNAVQEYMRENGTNGSTGNALGGALGGTRMMMAKAPMLGATGGGADTNYVVYDDDTAEQITLEGPVGVGTVITGLAEGQLSAASTDAVNGSQVYALSQRFNEWDSAMSNLSSAVGVAQADISNLKTNYIIANSDINTLKTQVNAGFNVLANGAKVKNVNPDSNYVNFVAGNNIVLEDDNGSIKISSTGEGGSINLENGKNSTVVTTVTDEGTFYSINVNGNGQVNPNEERLVTGQTMFDELRPANGNYVSNNNTTAANLLALDEAVKAISEAGTDDALAVHYDNNDKGTVTFAGANGTVLTNVADGLISADSKDAVNGKQLFDTNQRVEENANAISTLRDKVGTVNDGNYVSADATIGENINTLDNTVKSISDDVNELSSDFDGFKDAINNKADTDLGNITDDGKNVISDIAKDSIAVTGSGYATVTESDIDFVKTYNVDVKANGKVAKNDNGLVTGGTVYDSIQGITDEAKEYADALDKANRDDTDAKLKKKANVDASNINVDAWAKVLGTGEVTEGNTNLVNGGVVYDAISKVNRANNLVEMQDNTIFVGARESGNVISVYNKDGEGRIITGVVTNPNDATSAANVGYVNAVSEGIMGNINGRFSEVNNKISDVGANAAAMSALMPVGDDADKKWSLSASVGHYDSSTASAVGLFYKPSDNVIVNVRGTVGSDENMLAGGVSVALDKGSTPGVSKAQLVRTVNAQASEINTMKQEREQDRERIAKLEQAVRYLASQNQNVQNKSSKPNSEAK